MPSIRFYKATPCGYCTAALRFLTERKGIQMEEIEIIDLTGDFQARRALAAQTGQRTVPQIYINDHYVGGYSDLIRLEGQGEVDVLLQKDNQKPD